MQRIKNIFIFLRILPNLFKKRFENIDNPKNILIIQTAKLGDMVCATPMFRAIKKKYPKCNVWVMGNKINKELLAFNSDVAGYIEWQQEFSKNIQKIKEHNFDFACITGPNFEGIAALIGSDIKCIAAPTVVNGRSPFETRLYRYLSKFCIKKTHQMGSYAPREYLKLLEPIGIHETDTKKHLAFSNDALNKAESIIKKYSSDNQIFNIAIAPGAGNKIKEWPIDRFAKVADYLIESYKVKVFLIGNKNDKDLSVNLLSKSKHKDSIADLCGELSIDELKAFISKMNLFISVDTGPIYIAEAFDIPTIDIVGPMDEREQPPIGEKNVVVISKNRNKPVIHIMNAREFNHKEARRLVEDISAEMVIEKVDVIMNKIK